MVCHQKSARSTLEFTPAVNCGGAALISASSGTKTPPAEFQKPITWFLWVMIGFLLLRSAVLGVVLSGEYKGEGVL